jgi:hypothetical protein
MYFRLVAYLGITGCIDIIDVAVSAIRVVENGKSHWQAAPDAPQSYRH